MTTIKGTYFGEPVAIIACVDRRHEYDKEGWLNNKFIKYADGSETIASLTREEFDMWKKILPVWSGRCQSHP